MGGVRVVLPLLVLTPFIFNLIQGLVISYTTEARRRHQSAGSVGYCALHEAIGEASVSRWLTG